MADREPRYILIATHGRRASAAYLGEEYQADPAHVATWGKPEGDVIAAGTLEACRAAGRLLLEAAR